MTVGVRLSRMGRNRGRNLYAEYGPLKDYGSVGKRITTGDTSSTGQTLFAGMQLAGSIAGAAYGSGGGGGGVSTGITFIADFTPLGALFGKLFGVKSHRDVYGKEYTEFQVFNSKYGIPINEGDGNVRLAGNVIWTLEPKEVILKVEQQMTDNPLTFMDYRSRVGLTKQQILDQGIQYNLEKYTQIITYEEFHYVLSFAVAFANIKDHQGEIVRIWADKEVIWDVRDSNLNEPTQLMSVGFRDSAFHKFYKDTLITVYNGKHTDRDPTIVADKGDYTPAYKNICYAVFKNLDLNDFNGRIPIIEAEVAYRSSPVKYVEGLGTGSEGWKYNNEDVGWVHDTTDGYLIGATNYPHYYDLDVYECFAFRSPKIFDKGQPINGTGGNAGIHGAKYGYIYTAADVNIGTGFKSQLRTVNAYIARNRNKTAIWKSQAESQALFNFNSTKDAVYNYDISFAGGDIYSMGRKVIYAYGIFGTSIMSTYIFVQGMQAQGWIMPDNYIQTPLDNLNNNSVSRGNKIIYPTLNNQSGGINTTGDFGGMILDKSGAYRVTSDSGVFGTHGPPAHLWNYEYNGSGNPIGDSPLYSPQYVLSETAGVLYTTLLEDLGKLTDQDNGLLLIQLTDGKLIHFNTTLDNSFSYVGRTKESTITPGLDRISVQQLPMSGLLPSHGLFNNTGGLTRMVNCVDLEYTGTDWSLAPEYPSPVGIPYVGSVPATATFHWFTVMGMSATAYGNYAPLLMCKYRYSAANPTLAEVVSEIILPKVPYITAADIDVSTLTDIVRGYMMADTSKLAEFIERLRKGYFFDVTESDGKLEFIKRGIIDTVIPVEETILEDPIKASVESVADMSKEGVLNYADIDFDYLQNSQRHRRELAKSLSLIENTLPIVFNADEAARVAKIYINGSYAEAIEIQATLDRSYSYLQCTDIISIGIYNRIRITNIVLLQDGGVQIQGVTEDQQIYNSSAKGVAILNYKSLSRLSSSKIQAFPFETTYIDTQINNTIGYVYIPAFKRFTDSSISVSVAIGDGTYKYIGSTNPNKFIGRAVNRLLPPNYSTKHGAWDYDNYIDIFIQQGNPPLSATKNEVYLGANKVRIGREILAFTTVESLGGSRYKLTGLLRGRDGTELFTRMHNTGEYAIELYSDIPKLTISESLMGQVILIKGKERYTSESIGSYVIRGLSFTLLAPANVRIAASGNDIIISCTRRNSANGELIPLEDIPQGNISSYSVDILNNNMDILRTITSSTETFTYTSAQQIVDFGSNQTALSFVVYQHTPTIRGYGTYTNLSLVPRVYYNDFSTETIGVQPSTITIQSGSITALPTVDIDGRKSLEIDTGDTLASSSISFGTINSLADGDIRFKFKYDTFYGFQETYLLKVYLKSANSIVNIKSDGTITCETVGELDSVAYTETETFNYGSSIYKNIIYNVRVQYYEEILRVKIWKDIEPSTWLFSYFPEVIASQPDFTLKISGYVGVGSYTKNCKLILKDIEINDLY